MKQWRVLLGIAIVALGSAAIWAWQEGLRPDSTLARAEPSVPAQQPPLPPPDQSTTNDPTPSPAPPSSPQAEPAPAVSDGDQTMPSAAVEPPSVDTPEPAERKFARGGRAEPDQN
jgi:hypothetical protein